MNEIGLSYPAVDTVADIVPLSDGRVQIRTPGSRLTIGRQAKLAVDLIRLCDGTRSLEDVIASLADRGHPREQTRELVNLLGRRAVLLSEAPPDCQDRLLAHALHLARRSTDGSKLPDLMAERPVQVCGSGHLAEAVRADLTSLDIRHVDPLDSAGADAALIVACSDYENHASFRERNRAAVMVDRPIFFACIAETGVRFGPLVVPRETACFECFHHRLRANVAFREELDAYLAHNAFMEASGMDSRSAIYARMGSAFVCAQVLHFLLGSSQHCVLDKLVEVSPITVDLVTSRVLKLPRCEVCGPRDESAPPAPRDWL
jgi:bacteriocin biosynthesis cyclodehydratase domain-containing protein